MPVAAAATGGARLLRRASNGGFAAGANAGARVALEAGADALAFVNPDCFVHPGWRTALLASLADPAVGVVGARLLEADGRTLQHAGGRIGANALTAHLGRGLAADDHVHAQAAEVDYVCGASLGLRADVWRACGPFDEGYRPAYFEEVELCARVRERALTVRYEPSVGATHLEASSTGAGSAAYLRAYHRNRIRFAVRRRGRVHPRAGAGWSAFWRAELAWLWRSADRAQYPAVARAWAAAPRFAWETVGSR